MYNEWLQNYPKAQNQRLEKIIFPFNQVLVFEGHNSMNCTAGVDFREHG